MYEVNGTTKENVKAFPVYLSACSLKSISTFIIKTPNKVWIWHGTISEEYTKSVARQISSVHFSNCEIEDVSESEPEEFWQLLGGKAPFCQASHFQLPDSSEKPRIRFFRCSDQTGPLKVEEFQSYSQEDFSERDIVLLDVEHSVYCWIGKKASEKAIKKSLEVAQEYVATRPPKDSFQKPSSLYKIYSGKEPVEFCAFFLGWWIPKGDFSARKLESIEPTETSSTSSRRSSASASSESSASGSSAASSNSSEKDLQLNIAASTAAGRTDINPNGIVVEFARLKIKPPPDSVDGHVLEAYLSVKDFIALFKMTPTNYYKLPKWQQIQKKKEAGVF